MNAPAHATEPGSARASARFDTIDVLRGAALMAILLAHCMGDFIGWWNASPGERQALPFPTANAVVDELAGFFVRGKARGIFALMFGVAFFLQMQRALREDVGFRSRMLYRLLILLLLGALHAHLLYGGDILRYYAVGGLLLLAAVHWRPRTQLAVGLLLIVVLPVLVIAISNLIGYRPSMGSTPLAEINAGFQSSALLDVAWANHETAKLRYLPLYLLMLAPVSGMLLLGVWLAGLGWLQAPQAHLPALRRMCAWGIGIGITVQVMALLVSRSGIEMGIAARLMLMLAQSGAEVALTLGYVAGICLLLLRNAWRRPLSLLAPAGRMTLTNYIMQSAFAWVIFYGVGLGLYLRIGPALGLPIALLLCTLQLWLSWWWLKRFRTGPAEALWRRAIGIRPRRTPPASA